MSPMDKQKRTNLNNRWKLTEKYLCNIVPQLTNGSRSSSSERFTFERNTLGGMHTFSLIIVKKSTSNLYNLVWNAIKLRSTPHTYHITWTGITSSSERRIDMLLDIRWSVLDITKFSDCTIETNFYTDRENRLNEQCTLAVQMLCSSDMNVNTIIADVNVNTIMDGIKSTTVINKWKILYKWMK